MGMIWSLIVFIFWCVLGFALLHACLTHFIFWYEHRLAEFQNEKVIKLSYPIFFKSLLIEFACVLLKTLLFPFKFVKLPTKFNASMFSTSIESPTPPPPVLLVHGYLNHQLDWLWFFKKLEGYSDMGPVFALNLTPAFAPMSQLALDIKDKIAEIRQLTGASQIILVGHSMGGLVSSFFTEYLAGLNEVAMVITLGSPFQGTQMAALGYGKNVVEMQPQSPFLKELNSRILQSRVPYYAIASKIDNMVIPWQSGLLPIETNEIGENTPNTLVLEDHGHLRFLISPVVVEQVYQWIHAQMMSRK